MADIYWRLADFCIQANIALNTWLILYYAAFYQ